MKVLYVENHHNAKYNYMDKYLALINQTTATNVANLQAE
jgi:hypothetical protein